MAWSTRELAELAGTTENTVRHYHRLGLLEEPERRPNGYKRYEVSHLVRLLRIRRLADLGVPLSRIGPEGVTGDIAETLRGLDQELAATVDRLQKVRAQIESILNGHAPADAPAGFESIASRLSEADNSLLHIYTQLYNEDALADLQRMVEDDLDAVGAEVDRLPPDADESARQVLIDRLTPILVRQLREYPWLRDPRPRLSKSVSTTQQTFNQAMLALYNPAQLDVLYRAGALAAAEPHPGDRDEEAD